MTAQPEPWPSTKAFTVYNVLRLRGTKTMAIPHVTEYLREVWDPAYPSDWVSEGATWLIERGFMRWEGELLAVNVFDANGKIAKLARANGDADLRIVT